MSIGGKRFLSSNVVVKKTHPVRNFFLKLTLATTVFYAGGVALSNYNYQFAELFTDNVPLAEELVQFVESYNDGTLNTPQLSLEDIRSKFGSLTRKVQSIPHMGSTSEPVREPEACIAKLSEKGEPLLNEHVPTVLLTLPLLKVQSSDALVANLIESFNKEIQSVNDKHVMLPEQSVDLITENYLFLSKQLTQLSKDLSKDLNDQLSKLSSDLKENIEAEKRQEIENNRLALLKQFEKDLSNAKVEFEQRYESQLQSSLKANEQALLAKHKNELAMLSIKQVQEFNKIISDKVENERNGKLKNLNDLNDSIAKVSDSLSVLESTLIKSECINQLTKLVSSIRFKLNLDQSPSLDLSKDVNQLKTLVDIIPDKPKQCCSKEPQLIDVVLSELTTISSKPSSKILSNEQLFNRWNLLQDKIREASLLPPNAGFLGHVSAKFFSLFLFNKTGISPDNDIDSVISRVSENIRMNKLDKAVEDVVQLQGWSRLEAEDWLQAARTKLEFETLVDVIDHEIKTL